MGDSNWSKSSSSAEFSEVTTRGHEVEFSLVQAEHSRMELETELGGCTSPILFIF